MFCHAASQKLTNISEEPTAHHQRLMMEAVSPLKHWSISTRLHGATSQSIVIFMLTPVRTWNLTSVLQPTYIWWHHPQTGHIKQNPILKILHQFIMHSLHEVYRISSEWGGYVQLHILPHFNLWNYWIGSDYIYYLESLTLEVVNKF